MNKKAFTLIEIMVGIIILSLIFIGGFKAYSGVLIGKIKLMESTNIQKQAFYFSEKFFEEIKKGGTIDYEEYFNRKIVGTLTSSGHYDKLTGFGNYGTDKTPGDTSFGKGIYYCISGSGTLMGTGGCVTGFNSVGDVSGLSQRYGQYAFHFIDYNSNFNDDSGDEDGDGNAIGDDDDEYLGQGPVAFSGSEVKEIYLISADNKKRTYFRWTIKDDLDDPNNDCDYIYGSGGCNSTIEFLRLEGRDWGLNHQKSGTGLYDGIIDTWLINKDFTGGTEIIAGTGTIDSYWQPLFGKNINVEKVKFFLYPNKDRELAWKDTIDEINIAPYLRIQMTLSPSYNARKGIRGKIPKIKINTTISLTDIYTR